jgi:prepilin-type processing-associated H-X9-DG protein
MDNDKKLFEELLKADGIDPTGATESERIVFAKMLDEQSKSKQLKPSAARPNIWRIIMKTKITKFAAAAVIIIAVLIGTNQFSGSSVAWGDILKNIQNAKTLTWKTTLIIKGQTQQVIRVMVLEPYNMRVELEDGKVWILDHSKGKTLVLEPSRKLAMISSTAQKSLDIYNTFKNFQNMEGFTVEEIGQKQINEKLSIGFRLTKEDGKQEKEVWADIETGLPVLIETTETDVQSSLSLAITDEIVFDVELDNALFDIEAPEGYEKISMDGPSERASQLKNRAKSAVNIHQILKNCHMYAEDNGDEWPNSLSDLLSYGLYEEALVNPRQPERENGYVYLKPEGSLSPSDIVLYEAYGSWSDGINVGFADGHIEFIKEELDFGKRLLK